MQQQQQQQQTPSYHPNAAGAAAGSYQPEFGGGGAKATRRKGRDMERALARGDLGALGSEVRTGEEISRVAHSDMRSYAAHGLRR